MYETGLVLHFEAAHRLRGDFGPATRTHGHTYRVEIVLRGPELDDTGVLCDLGKLTDEANAVVGALHYRDLDELSTFAGRNSTAEVVAKHIFDTLSSKIRTRRLNAMKVSVWESPSAFAAYEGPLQQ